VTALSVDLADRDVRTQVPAGGESGGEGAGVGHPSPGVAPERVQEVAHRFGEAFVGGLGERQPAAGPDLPVVDARKPSPLERSEGRGRQPQKPLDLDDLALAENRFEGAQQRYSSPLEHLVDEVDVESDVPRGWARGHGRRAASMPNHATFRPVRMRSVTGTPSPGRRVNPQRRRTKDRHLALRTTPSALVTPGPSEPAGPR